MRLFYHCRQFFQFVSFDLCTIYDIFSLFLAILTIYLLERFEYENIFALSGRFCYGG
ncbi:hypothetical protein GCWU000342_00081 [Shuttleworthella satelles DSM 14600]|uniref:Uncharacterized protein n=1 Tax=Shuttleworthella satelles DSM 14600 TaxID=626523 RepID=C4G8B4_9FIRM|nr:hypothetical protein GCWU000342_00081 [Shuttleworthia satelles DSM 14600]